MIFGEHAKCQAEAEYPELWQGLVGAWSPCLSPPGGTILRDLSGRGNHGTLTNMDPATDWVLSGGRSALDFDGSNDYVSLPINGMSVASGRVFTVSAWVSTSSSANDICFLCIGTLTGDRITLFANTGSTGAPNGSVEADFRSGASRVEAFTAGTFGFNNGRLRNVIGTRESDGMCRCYVDGMLVATSAGASTGAITPTDARIGHFSGYVAGFLSGRVFDVLYSHSLLSPRLLYRLGPGGWATPRRRRWNYATAQTAIPYWVFARNNARIIGGGVS